MTKRGGAGAPPRARGGLGPQADAIDPSFSAQFGVSLSEEQLSILSSFQGGSDGRGEFFRSPLSEEQSFLLSKFQDDGGSRHFIPGALPAEELVASSFPFDPGGSGSRSSEVVPREPERWRNISPIFQGDLDGRDSSSPVLQRLRQNKYLHRLAHFSGPNRRRSGARFLTDLAAVTSLLYQRM